MDVRPVPEDVDQSSDDERNVDGFLLSSASLADCFLFDPLMDDSMKESIERDNERRRREQV